MDSPWTYALIVVALIVMAVSYRVPRAWRWIGVGALSFFASTLFGDYVDRGLHPFFTLLCDTTVCVSVYAFYEEDWEVGVFLAFLVSVFCSALKLGGFIGIGWVYPSLLEICNLGALLWISHVGILQLIGSGASDPVRNWNHHLHRSRHSL
jgi:hypothetical protein